jgi:excisionase family DNA binding protein
MAVVAGDWRASEGAAMHEQQQTDNLTAQEITPAGRRPRQPRSGDGRTPREVARRYRVSPATVRRWIRAGELVALAIGTTARGGPRLVVTPESLEAFERRHQVGPAPKPPRRRRQLEVQDFYPD